MKTVTIDSIKIGEGTPLAFFAGPCVIESRDHTMQMAEDIKELSEETGAPIVFKVSYDKANRSSIESYRGPGVEEGAEILAEVKREFGLPILTDVHEPWQVEIIGEVADVIQVPAFLCRQTDLILEIAESERVVNVKKGQFLAPWDMKQVISKITSVGNEKILLTERGASFGYNNLVSDMRSIPIMQEFGYPVVFDATHSAQLPGGLGKSTGGMREHIPALARAAIAAGVNAIFMEIHNDVENALSDSTTQWPLQKARALIQQLQAIYEVTQQLEEL
ncbi:MAG: 3-deoxy-8-phosphooctulonate synthase [Candidatus Marinimicrobia bacterium]|nr:3-deoxy-8-phosphooctulonate synthase [Candidatus Neomarinimicrobiota bacterium]MCF7829512.1 3-deoxy-8-phosphooctulonate synthase [Candidatus Neomarinimicrobiota bacterium]MCF7880090.1 3-deoxy-8-phosphooctulonate synthase [Candidatus Neomarinimicrobiota bacterium]